MRAPRAAAIAGIAFAAMFAAAVSLFRSAMPAEPDDAGAWLASDGQRARVRLALAMLPFAGIAFLWFIGVIRDHLGEREDRFFATVFLGSGVLFVSTVFIGGAVMATLVGLAASGSVDPEVWQFGRRIVYVLMNTYGLRMAAVFAIATTTLARRLGVLPRWLLVVGYGSAAALLLAAGSVPWVELVFPLWIMLVSIEILRAGGTALEGADTGPTG